MKKQLLYIALFLLPLFGISQPSEFLLLDGTESIQIPNSNNINTFLVTILRYKLSGNFTV